MAAVKSESFWIQGRISWAALDEPRASDDDDGRENYEVSLMFPKEGGFDGIAWAKTDGEALSAERQIGFIVNAAEEATEKAFPKNIARRLTAEVKANEVVIRDGDEKNADGTSKRPEHLHGQWYVRATTGFRPAVAFGAKNRKTIQTQKEPAADDVKELMRSGHYAMVDIHLYAFTYEEKKDGKKTGVEKQGVSAGFGNVWIIKTGDPIYSLPTLEDRAEGLEVDGGEDAEQILDELKAANHAKGGNTANVPEEDWGD